MENSVRVSLGYLRHLASWKPFTDPNSALGNVAFQSGEDTNDGVRSLTAMVTDRYRIVMRTDSDSNTVWENNLPSGEKFLMSMTQLVQFVTATKATKNVSGVFVDVTWTEGELTISGLGSVVTDRNPKWSYPKVDTLVSEWTVTDNPVGTTGFDVTRVGDFAKIISPKTGKKYVPSWKFEQGKGSSPERAGAYRLTNVDDANVVALIQPMLIK